MMAPSKQQLAAAFAQGQAARRASPQFVQIYAAGPLARKFYEGWCELNLVLWLAKHPQLR